MDNNNSLTTVTYSLSQMVIDDQNKSQKTQSQSQGRSIVDRLPDDILRHISGFVPGEDTFSFVGACKTFKQRTFEKAAFDLAIKERIATTYIRKQLTSGEQFKFAGIFQNEKVRKSVRSLSMEGDALTTDFKWLSQFPNLESFEFRAYHGFTESGRQQVESYNIAKVNLVNKMNIDVYADV